jgi:hypothetical protein
MAKRMNIGAVVIEELLNNMRAGAERLYYTVQVPSIYHVYLHHTDYEKLAPIEAKLIAEAKHALDDELAAQNREPRRNWLNPLNAFRSAWHAVSEFLGRPAHRRNSVLKHERGANDWRISVYRDTVNDLKPGDVLIDSELAPAAQVELGAGLATKTIRTIRSDGQTRSFAVNGAGASNRVASLDPAAVQTVTGPTLRHQAFAQLRYQDQQGSWCEYLMEKEKINIGKGNEPHSAPSYWVDLALDFADEVAPLHIQLFFDPSTKKFHIKDLSATGTRVNGRLVKSSLVRREGKVVDLDLREELPTKARISLTGKMILDFKSLLTI